MHLAKMTACCVSGVVLLTAMGGPAAAQKGMGAVKAAKAGAMPADAAAPPAPVTCGSSIWVPDSRSTNHATDLPNPSGVATPKSLTVYFSPGGSAAAFPVQWSWGSAVSGNPVTVSVSSTNVTLHVFSGAPLHGTWDARTNPPSWSYYDSGFWRVTTCN